MRVGLRDGWAHFAFGGSRQPRLSRFWISWRVVGPRALRHRNEFTVLIVIPDPGRLVAAGAQDLRVYDPIVRDSVCVTPPVFCFAFPRHIKAIPPAPSIKVDETA